MTEGSPRRSGTNHEGEIWLVRHGETEWSAGGRHTGLTDVPLTVEGRNQAAALVRPLAAHRFGLVLSSPLGRARETARIAGFADAPVDEDLLEWDYGDDEGLTTRELRDRRPGWTLWSDGVTNGETAAQVAARAERVLARTGAADGDTLLFAHGHVLRVLTAVYLGFEPAAGGRFALGTGAIGVLGWENEHHALRRWSGPRTV